MRAAPAHPPRPLLYLIESFELYFQLPDAKLPREIHLKADKGEIDVFLCPDDTYQQSCDPLLDDIRPIVTPIVEKYLSPRSKIGKRTDFGETETLIAIQFNPVNSICLSIPKLATGKPSTYPLRTAQRNLNKILLGDGDDGDSLGDSTNASTSSKAAPMLEIGTILEHSRTTPIVSSNSVQGNYCTTLKKEPSTSASSSSSQQQQQHMNGSAESHIAISKCVMWYYIHNFGLDGYHHQFACFKIRTHMIIIV